MTFKFLILPIVATFTFLTFKPTTASLPSVEEIPSIWSKTLSENNWVNVSQSLKKEVIDIDYLGDKMYLTTSHETYVTSIGDTKLEDMSNKHTYSDELARNYIPTAHGTYMINQYGRLKYYDPIVKSWSKAFESLENKYDVFDLVFMENTTLVATFGGVQISQDGGKTWSFSLKSDLIHKLKKFKTDIVAYDSHHISLSKDNGQTWTTIFKIDEAIQDFDINEGVWTAVVNRPQILLPGAPGPFNLHYQDLLTSYDQGKTWNNISKNIPYSGVISNFEIVGTSWIIGTGNGVLESKDQGKSWTKVIPEIKDRMYNISTYGQNVFATIRSQGGC
jgi:hypothetical protein